MWDKIIGAGATLLGAYLGGKGGNASNNATATTQNDPWKPQQPYLLGGFQDAANAYNSVKDSPFYTGNLYAGLTPLQNQSISGIQGFATGAGQATANNILSAGRESLGGAAGQMGVAGQLASFDPSDPTRSNIRAAGQYADNPYLNGMIRAASRDVTRNLSEDVLPGINRLGSVTGNTNSSRTGVAEGIALRGAQDRIGDIASQMRGNAYQEGLGLAENARTANMNAQLNALSNAGNLYGNAFGQGIQGATAGAQQMYNNFDALSQAGGLQQQDQQGQINADFARWQGNDTRNFDMLDRYMQLVKGSYGSTSTNSQNNGQPSWMNTLQGAIGGASTGLGLYKDFKDLFKG